MGVLNDRSLADIENRRHLLLKEKTSEFQFEIGHVPGRLHVGPDTMSRNPVNVTAEAAVQNKQTTDEVRRGILYGLASVEVITASDNLGADCCSSSFQELLVKHQYGCCGSQNVADNVITWDNLIKCTAEDQEMSELRSFIHAGLTEDGRKVPKSVKPYLQYRSSLYELGDGVIMLGDKIVIPKK